jgi:hypothetical protein
VDTGQTGTHTIGQDPALSGEAYPPVIPIEQGAAEPPLQLADGVTNRRLADLQFICRAGKAVMAGHDGERVQTLNGREVTCP